MKYYYYMNDKFRENMKSIFKDEFRIKKILNFMSEEYKQLSVSRSSRLSYSHFNTDKKNILYEISSLELPEGELLYENLSKYEAYRLEEHVNEKSAYIYILELDNTKPLSLKEKYYVGQTTNIFNRIQYHLVDKHVLRIKAVYRYEDRKFLNYLEDFWTLKTGMEYGFDNVRGSNSVSNYIPQINLPKEGYNVIYRKKKGESYLQYHYDMLNNKISLYEERVEEEPFKDSIQYNLLKGLDFSKLVLYVSEGNKTIFLLENNYSIKKIEIDEYLYYPMEENFTYESENFISFMTFHINKSYIEKVEVFKEEKDHKIYVEFIEDLIKIEGNKIENIVFNFQSSIDSKLLKSLENNNLLNSFK